MALNIHISTPDASRLVEEVFSNEASSTIELLDGMLRLENRGHRRHRGFDGSQVDVVTIAISIIGNVAINIVASTLYDLLKKSAVKVRANGVDVGLDDPDAMAHLTQALAGTEVKVAEKE